MISSPAALRFFIDQNVPDSVGHFLNKRGYAVIFLREKIPTASPDALVAAVAEANNAILITFDPDFKALPSRIGIGKRRFAGLSLIRFEKCREAQAAMRMESAISLIEHEWSIIEGKRDRRLFMGIIYLTPSQVILRACFGVSIQG